MVAVFALAIIGIFAVGAVLKRGVYLWWFGGSPDGGWLLFDFASVAATLVVGFAAGFAVLAGAAWVADYAYRWLRWALTGVWVAYSEEIDEIESA